MKKILIALMSILCLAGAGCSYGPQETIATATPPAALPANPSNERAGWKTISIAGVATVQIPAHCNGGAGAGSNYITCPTPDNDTPIPELVISSDGQQISIDRWEDLESLYWDDIVASLRLQVPLSNALQINIDK